MENAPELQEFLAKEFPDAATTELSGSSRRRFLQLMGASFALAGAATGCRWEKENILPYARRPEGLEPGTIRYFSTGMELAGAMQALQVASYDNRPFKVEPHPRHPFAQGGTDAYAQASMLELFDPDRSGTYLDKNAPSTAEGFATFARQQFQAAKATGGRGVRVLARASSSPSMGRLKQQLMAEMPSAKWVQWESLSRDNAMLGSKLAFGSNHRTHLDLKAAKVIVSLDDDIFGSHPARLRLAKDWSSARKPDDGVMNRMYVVESRYTSTGAAADHRLPLRSEQVKAFSIALEGAVKAKLGMGAAPAKKGFLAEGKASKWVDAIADDLVANKGKGVVTVGAGQDADIHALGHRLNSLLGNAGATVTYTSFADREAEPAAFKALVDEMQAGQVDTLVILGGNPVYDAPGDLDFAAAMAKVKTSIHLGLFVDETAKLASWHVPMAHYLETWGDGRTWDGTLTIAQPMITPLFNGMSALELVAMMAGDFTAKPMELVKASAMAAVAALTPPPAEDAAAETPAAEAAPAEGEAEAAPAQQDLELETARQALAAFKAGFDWRKTVHDGFVAGTAFPTVVPALLDFSVAAPAERAFKAGADLGNGELEVVFYEDGKVYDGRFANNGWLQETPDFMTKLTWDNAAVMSPATAIKLGVTDRDLIKVAVGGKSVDLAVYVQPGQPTGSIAMAVGYGRTAAGIVGGYKTKGYEQVGFDVNPLRRHDALFAVEGAQVTKTGGTYKLATTQTHHMIDTLGLAAIQKRAPNLVRAASAEEYAKEPEFAKEMDHEFHHKLSLFEEMDWGKGYQWGMTVDLSNCIGCNACVVACTSENNVPIVGKDQVLVGREMHWMRIDRYFKGDSEDPVIAHMPMACVHCQNAPCEQVCPVGATMHGTEGTNDMAYNRCIGTRYCANNCPYKVRRFNFHNYNEDLKDPKNKVKTMVFNPDVTVRFRGVMEKCTYCTQRIHYAKRTAKVEGRALKDGDIVVACQAACPTDAIVFGDINDKNSQVSKKRALARSYEVLKELNIKPRTLYLAQIRNPNPALAEA
ncbi:MAG: TAT-variant-translocated molybdopterin oxidoreductase [Myxococcales bacterium]|nr:TAT-variant-translocated molybdopterin oxidoreductase [Myxococcales bacterium]